MKLTHFTLVLLNSILFGYSKVLDDCVCGQDAYYRPPNIKSERIVNGTEVGPHRYPWMAFLSHPWSGICGGSIITDKTILSAGHCVYAIFDPLRTRWIVGVHSIEKALNDEELSYGNDHIYFHPLYHRTMLFDIYDMSIFILETKIPFGPKISPICQPHADDDKLYWNRKAIVAGWGRIEEKGPLSDILMETQVVLKSDEECRNMTDLNAYTYDAMICAHEIYRDSCQVCCF
ncbi:hypothetical protein ACKWTF_013779 [Chironomus riparius]